MFGTGWREQSIEHSAGSRKQEAVLQSIERSAESRKLRAVLRLPVQPLPPIGELSGYGEVGLK